MVMADLMDLGHGKKSTQLQTLSARENFKFAIGYVLIFELLWKRYPILQRRSVVQILLLLCSCVLLREPLLGSELVQTGELLYKTKEPNIAPQKLNKNMIFAKRADAKKASDSTF